MARILILTVDVDLPGKPVNGGVLRVRQLHRHLSRLGHEVVVSMPIESLISAGGSEQALESSHPNKRPVDVVNRVNPDYVLCEQWHLASLLPRIDMPLWMDLHGSLLGENSFRQSGGQEEAARYESEILAKLTAFERADVVSCTGSRQRLYFRGWQQMAAGDYRGEVFHLPMAVPPAGRVPKRSDREGLRFAYSGNLWPWIDLSSWLPAFFDALSTRLNDQIHFFVDDPLGRKDCFRTICDAGQGRGLDRLIQENRISVKGRLPHASFRKRIRTYDIALDLFSWNFERELAVTTRTLEFLALGVPVLYPRHAELASMIGDADCGWLLDPTNAEDISATIDALDAESIRRRDYASRALRASRALDGVAQQRCCEIDAMVRDDLIRPSTPTVDRRFKTLVQTSLHEDLGRSRKEIDRTTRELDQARETLAVRCAEHQELVIRLDRELEGRSHRIEVVESELAALTEKHNQLTVHTRGAEKEIESQQDLRSHLESELQGRTHRIASIERELNNEHNRAEEFRSQLESAWGEAAEHLSEYQAVETELRIAREEVAQAEQAIERERNELRAILDRYDESLERSSEFNRLLHSQVEARQVVLLVKEEKPSLARRGIIRKIKLSLLMADHMVTRVYLAVWQRLRQRRIFPGM